MAKKKKRAAASQTPQRRAPQRQTTNIASRMPEQRQKQRRRSRKQHAWWLIGSIVAIMAVVIGIFFFLSNQHVAAIQSQPNTAFSVLTHIDSKELATIGSGTATNPMQPAKGAPLLKGPDGKPEVLYVGAEYCPYCAAQRWAVIAALSRFGSFQHVQPLTSSESNVPTFTFHGSSYSSPYVDFVSRETQDNQSQPLETLSASEQSLFKTFDSPPYTSSTQAQGIPFIDIANQQVSSGVYFSANIIDVLAGQSYQDSASQLKDPNSDLARAILGGANDLTAAICIATGNKPGSVCSATPIPEVEGTITQLVYQSGQHAPMGSMNFAAVASLPPLQDRRF